MDDPTIIEDALTVDELVRRLEAIRASHGANVLLFMADYEPVVCVLVFHGADFKEQIRRALCGEEDVESVPHVIITDRFQCTDEEPDWGDALTVGEMLAELELIRAQWGGDTPVVMCDYEPVCSVGTIRPHWLDDSDDFRVVIVTDRYAA